MWCDMQAGIMNQWHLARFVIEMVEAGADVLILDHASTHWGKAARAMITGINIRLGAPTFVLL